MLRAFFIALSRSRMMRKIAEHSPIGNRMSKRFVAGFTVDDAMRATKVMNDLGIAVSIDNLGEDVTDAGEARASAQLYSQLLDEIARRGLNANVSLKLTHMGLDVDEPMAREIVSGLVHKAADLNSFIRVDMEGSSYTQKTLDFVKALHERHPGRVGTVIQSYLYRSEKDVEDLLQHRIRIRLCKGAYREPHSIAYQKKADVDASYLKLAKMLLKSGVYHGIATHDEKIIRATIAFARAEQVPPEAFEFQMLYGIRRDLQEQLVKDGWRMRVYIPFGTEWYPYFMRRLAERPANVLFIAKNFFRR